MNICVEELCDTDCSDNKFFCYMFRKLQLIKMLKTKNCRFVLINYSISKFLNFI